MTTNTTYLGAVEAPKRATHDDLSVRRSINQILEDLQTTYPVADQTVLRWTSVNPVSGAEFYYVAIFANGAWYTSIMQDNPNVQRQMVHEDLMEYLNKKRTNLKDIQVAVAFENLNW